MDNIGVVPRLLSALHSLPLWILIGFAAAGYAAIFVPSFGGIDLAAFKKEWGPWCWLDAITFSVLSVACAIDLFVKRSRSRARRRRQREEHRYFKIYAPLFAELMKIHITMSSAMGAPRISQRAAYAWLKLRSIKKRRAAIKAAWRALFDRKEIGPTGEVDYGGEFPIDEINRVVHLYLVYCDDELLGLVGRAVDTRMNDRSQSEELTADDIRLYDHIIAQRDRLKRMLAR